MTPKTILIAVVAALALIAAAIWAVPSAEEVLRPCLDLPNCLGL